ncbi:MAG: hypothetical protein AB8B84_07530 [Granulosicoccus sp.]
MSKESEPTPNHASARSAGGDLASGPVQWRKADEVMRLSRLGSFHQCRLSFMRILTRRMQRDKWQLSHREFAIDSAGVGYAVYSMQGPDRTYSLVAFAHDLPDELRSDRVIATAWDATFALFDGIPTQQDIERLQINVPVQEAGRLSPTELTLSRANRSVRLWEHVVSELAAGRQPDTKLIDSVGYLMRTTAVYGSGKFGASDRTEISSRAEFDAPFQAEMLTVYLIRTFVRDLVQHMANCRGGSAAATLSPEIARRLGIGNSTGLGMAPFLINHPQLFNNWIVVREEAIMRVRNQPAATVEQSRCFLDLLDRSIQSFDLWHSEHPLQAEKISALQDDIRLLRRQARIQDFTGGYPWNALFDWATEAVGIEAQECLASLILEPYADLVDGLDLCMSSPESGIFRIDGSMNVGALSAIIQENYSWALSIDWKEPGNAARAWYVSEEKLEPRLGERYEEPIADYEQPLAPARDIAALYETIKNVQASKLTAELLMEQPALRYAVRRVQLCAKAPYAEIRDNTISEQLIPFDMLRCKLSFFGATHFDPRSDRWLRICLYANAPYPEELVEGDADTWVYPTLHAAT